MKTINKFKEETGYTLEKRDNGYYYDDRLYLTGTAITALPDNLVVGGSLDLTGTAITALPDNLVVGGYLDLSYTAITSLPDNLTVGGSLYLSYTAITDTSNINRNTPHVFFWRNKSYVKADGVLSKVISHRGNVYRTQQIGSPKLDYLVTDGNKWSHGNSLKDAKEDLLYKLSNRDTSKYDSLTLESKLSFEKAIEAYRAITGACSFGTKDFVLNRLENKKSEYSVSEIIELTKNEYGGSSFENFFNKYGTQLV